MHFYIVNWREFFGYFEKHEIASVPTVTLFSLRLLFFIDYVPDNEQHCICNLRNFNLKNGI